jgi:hypothetical protein
MRYQNGNNIGGEEYKKICNNVLTHITRLHIIKIRLFSGGQ